MVQQGFRDHDHARRAKATLDREFLIEDFLDRVQLPIFSQTFNSHHRLSLNLLSR